MKRGEALKQFMAGVEGLNIMIEIDNDMNVIPADAALRIWEHLNQDIPGEKEEKHMQVTIAKPVTAMKPKKRKKLDRPKMIALRNAGWTYEKIADEMGCSPQTVINHIKKEA